MTHTFSSFAPTPSAGVCCFSLALCQGRRPSSLPRTLPASGLLGPPGSSSAKARGLNGMFSRGSVSPESHASEIRAKKGSGAVPI